MALTNPAFPVHQRYRLINPTEPQSVASSHRVLRTSDNTTFLATKIPNLLCASINDSSPTPNNGTASLPASILPTAAVPLSRILNHPNIISLIDITRNSDLEGSVSESGKYRDFTVWEDMNAGCLGYLMPDPHTYPSLRDEDSWHALASFNPQRFSLPESLCWHVLRSISRALLWLHTGVKETQGLPGEWACHDEDWHAILIMDVSPGQIWFKRPRGEETYGECKLGGFSGARVTGSVGGRGGVIADRPEKGTVGQMLYWAPEVYNLTAPWSRASDIYSLGAVIYCMMTGMPPPRNVDYNWQISRMTDRSFSPGLRHIVGSMIKLNSGDRPQTMKLVQDIDDRWAGWRATTQEGAVYIDWDDERRERGARGPIGGRGLEL